MVSKYKIGLGLAALFTAALVVPVFADGASDFQVNVTKAQGTLDQIASLIDRIHSHSSSGGEAAVVTAPTPQPGGGGAGGGGGRGQELFAASCKCHTVGNAPKLTHIGADATHTARWIAEYARNPKSKDPNSKMPAQRNVAAADLRAITAFLARQK
jgi:cytochrome c2